MVELELALLADAANSSREGKLNILGVFDTLYSASFPVQLPQFQLVMRFRADAVEAGRNYKVEIQMIDQDGKKLANLEAGLNFGQNPSRSKGMPLKGDHIVTIANISFQKAGTYEFVVFINDEVRKRIPLYVEQKAL